MARSFSKAKILSAFVYDGISNAVFRRGYASASSQGASVWNGGRGGAASAAAAVKNKKTGEESVGSAQKVSWVPDPKTGYYRPDDGAQEIDPVELRAMLLNNKKH